MVLGGEEGLEHEVCLDGAGLELVSKFKYRGTNVAECRRKVASGRKLQVLPGSWFKLGVCSLSVLGILIVIACSYVWY